MKFFLTMLKTAWKKAIMRNGDSAGADHDGAIN